MFKPLPTKGTRLAPSFTDLEMVFYIWFFEKLSFDGELTIMPAC